MVESKVTEALIQRKNSTEENFHMKVQRKKEAQTLFVEKAVKKKRLV